MFSITVCLQGFLIRRQHISSNQIKLPVIIEIGSIIAHAETAIVLEVPGTAFGKCTIAVIEVIIIVLMKVITYINIIPAIVVKVAYSKPQTIAKTALINTC